MSTDWPPSQHGRLHRLFFRLMGRVPAWVPVNRDMQDLEPSQWVAYGRNLDNPALIIDRAHSARSGTWYLIQFEDEETRWVAAYLLQPITEVWTSPERAKLHGVRST